eukprot:TRINITY_DN9489_c0_g1_i1.p1 TRINITY_DN9489_c0_g1~~TRINITY_DN9489_c0_g1_i1.p1  ORF type:complete len:241 (+),score=73.14 TRINITY_DN9489_c0_g1_i1:624-1346(+)
MPTNTNNNVPSDLKLIDITPLLIHPQKKAAKLLQISESMMCKRWKEATNRKWPFRSIQKYLKLLKQLKNENQDSKNGIQISIIYKKLKQALEPVSISLPLNKNVPVFSPLNFDDLDSLNVEDDKDEIVKNVPKNKKLKLEDDPKKKSSSIKNKGYSSEMENDVEVNSPPNTVIVGQNKKNFNNTNKIFFKPIIPLKCPCFKISQIPNFNSLFFYNFLIQTGIFWGVYGSLFLLIFSSFSR